MATEPSKLTAQDLLQQQHKTFYIGFFIAAVLLLVISHYVFDDKSFAQILCKELGFAGLISVILIFTVEKFTRERHEAAADELIERINKNLFYAILKRYIPEKVFEQVEKNVMEAKVYRTEHEVNYTIEEFPSNAPELVRRDYFLCTAQTRYILNNLLDQELEHIVSVQLERPLYKKLDEFCKVNDIYINGIRISDDDLVELVKSTKQHVIFSKPVEIQAKGKIEINTKSVLVKQKTDSEIWCSKLASDGLKLTISTPTKNVEVQAYANHAEKLDERINSTVTKQWALNHGIFPYQSIIFWWKPLNEHGDVNE